MSSEINHLELVSILKEINPSGEINSKYENSIKKLQLLKNQNLSELKQIIKKNKTIIKILNQHNQEFEDVKANANDVLNKLKEHKQMLLELTPGNQDSYAQKLEYSTRSLFLISAIRNLHQVLVLAKNAFKSNKYYETSLQVSHFEKCVSMYKLEQKQLMKSVCFGNLCLAEKKLRQDLDQELKKKWQDKIRWGKQFFEPNNTEQVTFAVNSPFSDHSWADILLALDHLSSLDNFCLELSKKLLDGVFEKIILKQFPLRVEESSLSVVLSTQKKDSEVEIGVSFETNTKILEEVKMVISFLGHHLSVNMEEIIIVANQTSKDLNKEKKNFKEKQQLLLTTLGKSLSLGLFKLLGDHVIEKLVPKSLESIQPFEKLVASAKKCQQVALENHLLQENYEAVSSMIGDAESAYIERKNRDALSEARRLIISPLEISTHAQIHIPLEVSLVEEEKEFLPFKEVFKFSSCKISSSVEKLWFLIMDLIKNVGEAGFEDNLSFRHLVLGIRKIFDLFLGISTIAHKEHLTNLPLIAALHHNNCFYLSHQLLFLHLHLLPLFPNPSLHTFFVDYVEPLRFCGSELLIQFLQQQKKEILEQDTFSFTNFLETSTELRTKEMERRLKMGLLKVSHLSRVWSQILPNSVSIQSIGGLLNVISDKMISDIVSHSDISEEEGKKLEELITNLESQSFTLFGNLLQKKGSVSRGEITINLQKHIETWKKLGELKFILGSSLVQIKDRWASGFGPLAEEFTNRDLDQLIRAIFQNTDFRSSVLSEINNISI